MSEKNILSMGEGYRYFLKLQIKRDSERVSMSNKN